MADFILLPEIALTTRRWKDDQCTSDIHTVIDLYFL